MIGRIKHVLVVCLIVSLIISLSLNAFNKASVPVQGVDQQYVTFSDDFSSDSGLWTYWGTAFRNDSGGNLVLTYAQAQAGVVWFKYMFEGNFTVSFRYQTGNCLYIPDSFGMVMMFLKERDYAKLGSLYWQYQIGLLGFSNPNNPSYGYGVEFDGSQDAWDPTPSIPLLSHVALIKDSTQTHLTYVNDTRIGDGEWHDAKIVVNGSSVTVSVDSGMVLSWSGSMDRTYGCFGFSASTAWAPHSHLIDDFSITIQGPVEEYVPSILGTYTNPRQQTDVPFGAFSFWHQPWRAYMDTWPVSWLLNSTGVMFFSSSSRVTLAQTNALAEHLAKNGFKQARVEVGWCSFSYDDPSKLIPGNKQNLDNILAALENYGIRPLFLLNANQGVPCPVKWIMVQLMEDASQGARQVQLQPGISGIVENRTGFNDLTQYWACEVLITHYDSQTGVANLSKPLPKLLKAGTYQLDILKYCPLGPLWQADGAPDPVTEETLQGWVGFVNSVATYAKSALGTEGKPDAGFDFEVWNELTFGSDFLDIRNYYYDPPLEGSENASRGWWPISEILNRTVRFVKNPGNNLPGVRVGDGFASTVPWGSGTDEPLGVDAIDKHPYVGRKNYPADVPTSGFPFDAYGEPQAAPAWAPNLTTLFPEYWLTALQTEYLCRDISPINTYIYGVEHGRFTHVEGGRPLNMWVTEVNIGPGEDDPNITSEAAMHIKAKTTLRYLVSFNNKGVERVYFFQGFTGDDKDLGMVSEAFFSYVNKNGCYPEPDDNYTSPVMQAVRNLMAYMGKTNRPVRETRQLEVLDIEEPEARIVFQGDSTWAHPTLYNRGVFGFFPYQADKHIFLIPYYVMTRDVMHVYQPGLPAGDPRRYDMTSESFNVTVGNVSGDAKVEAYDPILDCEVPVNVVSHGMNNITLTVEATDYPRILRLEEPDNAVIDVTPLKTVLEQGLSNSINVTVYDSIPAEPVSLTLYANQTIIGTLTNLNLASGNSTTLTFVWNTADFAYGNYTIWAYATPVPGETDIADNTYIDGTVQIVQASGGVNRGGVPHYN
jgi:hypothetical protein